MTLVQQFGAFQLFALSTIGIGAFDIGLVLFYIIFIKRLFWNGDKLIITHKKTLSLFLSFILIAALSGLFPLLSASNLQIIQFFKTFTHLFYVIFFAIICLIIYISPTSCTKLLQTNLLISIVVNGFAIYQTIARVFDLPFAWLNLTNYGLTLRGVGGDGTEISQLSLQFENFYRATSFFSEPSALAGFNIMIMILLIVPFFQGRQQLFKSSNFSLVIFLLSLIAVFLTFSLTALTGLVLIVVAVLIIERSKRSWYIFPALFFSIVTLIITDTIITNIADISVLGLFEKRIVSLSTGGKGQDVIVGESFYGRVSSISHSIDLWSEYPIFGAGLGQTQYHKKSLIMFSDTSIGHVLIELGSFGGIIFTCIFIVLLIENFRIRKRFNITDKIDPQIARNASVSIYMIVFIWYSNFFTANNVIATHFWYSFAIIILNMKNVRLAAGDKVFSIELLKTPLNKLFVISTFYKEKLLKGKNPELTR